MKIETIKNVNSVNFNQLFKNYKSHTTNTDISILGV